ncbi:DUF2231 domain-containing protein [Mycolicibacterium goodii]|uniref:DUF2231 domain-containing protein n=1 Tax=Mycolicibacterium goodii TaxID=134601 RepID=UPI001F0379E9|nr:DUF2231 domain-containing protein [Mycolicibacterium goodii]ULN49525.1 DUF2231 domain-containing protein [Mycolicibacterium goodii]
MTATGLARLLRGSWLGHPVHPLVVTVPTGRGPRRCCSTPSSTTRPRHTDWALPPPLGPCPAGWADFALLNRRQQRVGLVHAGSNAVTAPEPTASLFALTYRAYRAEKLRAARRYSVLGLLAMGVGGALGGHLYYARGAGVFRWQSMRTLTAA